MLVGTVRDNIILARESSSDRDGRSRRYAPLTRGTGWNGCSSSSVPCWAPVIRS